MGTLCSIEFTDDSPRAHAAALSIMADLLQAGRPFSVAPTIESNPLRGGAGFILSYPGAVLDEPQEPRRA